MLRGILILLFMVAVIILMVTRKMPTIIALLVLAIGICLIAGVPALVIEDGAVTGGFFKTVIQSGCSVLADAAAVAFFASWLGQVMLTTHITETIIKKGAELGGDKVLVVTLVLFAAGSLIFSSVNGLGTVIMLASIMVPILVSVGADKLTAGALVLFCYCVGNNFNISNVNVIAAIFGTTYDDTFKIQIVGSIVTFIAGVVFFVLRLRKTGKKYAFAAVAKDDSADDPYKVEGVPGVLAMLTPVIPVVLVLAFKFPLVISFIIGVTWGTLWTCLGVEWNKIMNMLSKCFIDGFGQTAPSVILFLEIGMILYAVKQPEVIAALTPFIEVITPKSAVVFFLFFLILAPLCLYRGPLNLWGLGAGIAALMAGLDILPLNVIMGGFCAVSVMQLLACPTNTHNAWVSSYVGEDVTKVTMTLLPWTYPAIVACLIATLVWFM